MKKLLFILTVIILTPIYLIMQILSKIFEFYIELIFPVADGIYILVENMCRFWRKVFKIKEEQHGSRD